MHVADDYEILIRTFLHTRMVHIQRFGYIQYIQRDGGNTQRGEGEQPSSAWHQKYSRRMVRIDISTSSTAIVMVSTPSADAVPMRKNENASW